MHIQAGRFIRRHPLLQQFLAMPRAVRRMILRKRDARAQMILNRLSSLVQDDIVIRVDEFDGVFANSPQSDLFRRIILFGSYEPEVSTLFFQNIQSDRDIIDVGANVGFYTVGGAKKLKGGRVLAAEPTAAAFARLRANVERNRVTDRVILFNGLIAAETGTRSLLTVAGREEYSSIGPLQHPSIKDVDYRTETVNAVRLDDLVQMHDLKPALLKVDVEGSEGEVFSGATRTISKFRPTVISEVSNHLLRQNGIDGREIVQFFERLDYRVTDPHDPKAEPGTSEFGDIFCTPREA